MTQPRASGEEADDDVDCEAGAAVFPTATGGDGGGEDNNPEVANGMIAAEAAAAAENDGVFMTNSEEPGAAAAEAEEGADPATAATTAAAAEASSPAAASAAEEFAFDDDLDEEGEAEEEEEVGVVVNEEEEAVDSTMIDGELITGEDEDKNAEEEEEVAAAPEEQAGRDEEAAPRGRNKKNKRGRSRRRDDGNEEEEQVEAANDDADEDDDDAMDEVERASKKKKKKKPRSAEEEDKKDDDDAGAAPAEKPSAKKSGAAEAGIISEIYLENFMCHPRLRIKLGRNANAITGDNGSGKSAVLAAIQICLGANARRTHRARNLKELVRREGGNASAKIQVTLLNGGPDAYKPDVYGGTITVQRCISLGAGSNGFSMLDHRKKQQSTSKKDLYEMLDHLNIQVENPVSILDQEESKKFLCGKPEDKYKFFMKATDLERMDMNYAATMDQLRELEAARIRAHEALEPLQAAEDAARRQFKQHDALAKLEKKVAQLNCDLLWAKHGEDQHEYEASVSKLQVCKDQVARKEKEVEESERKMKNPEHDQEGLQIRIQALLAESKEQAALKKDLDDKFRQATGPHKQVQNQIQNVKREIAKAEREAGAAQKRLKEYRDKMMSHEGSAESERTRMAKELQAMEEERQACKERADPLKQAVAEALRAYEEAEPKVQEAKHSVNSAARQLDRVKERLRSLKDQADEFAVFGPKVKAVHRLVEEAKRDRKFRGPVIGPIGKFVKVAPGHEKYAALAEHAMGNGILDRFIVTCDSDLKVLNKIRERVRCGRDCGVFQQTPSRRYDVPGPAVPGTETIASVISVSDDLVYNCLVDNAKIDQCALFSSKDVSEKLLLDDDGRGNCRIRDSNVKQVFFLPRGDKWSIIGNGNLFLASNDKELQSTSIGVDKRSAIANTEREMQQLDEELKRCKAEDGKCEAEHTQRQRDWNRAKRAMQQNDDRINDLASKILNLNSEIQASVSIRFDPSEYEEDVDQAEARVEKLKESVDRLTTELKNREPEIQDLKGQIAEVEARNKKVLADIEAVQKEQEKVLETQTQTITQVEKSREKLEKRRERLVAAEAEVEAKAAIAAESLRAARMATFMKRQQDQSENDESAEIVFVDPTDEDLDAIEPVVVTFSASKCSEKLKAQQAKVEKERRSRRILNETREEAYENYINAQNSRLKKQDEVENLSTDIDNMTNDLRLRNKRHRDMRNKLKILTTYKFDELMRMNDYSGELRFDDGGDGKLGTLDLVVRKGSGGQTTDVKGLSGGERSFSTMCLLLALGEKLETPFRIFDEFDVFLDAQTRRLVMKSMIHMAKKLENRQFIFITPQDLSSLKTDDKFRIYKLNPPVRHTNGRVDSLTQTTLNFAPQEED